MRTVTIDDVNKDWRKVIAEAEHAPLRVRAHDLPSVVILSEIDFERLRGYIGERLLETMDRMAATAKQRGLTEQKLDELLADES
ncbi:MAG: hypothetical protein ACREC6_01555 [Hyphomicrobiaceae bacterium]